MNTLIKNRFIEYNFLIFPIWILPVYFLTKSVFPSPEIALIIFLFLFGESHFASTFLFYFDKKNRAVYQNEKITYIYFPLLLCILFVLIGAINFQIAILIGAVASGIHVTRQSVGVTRLYSNFRNSFYEYLIYLSSFSFLSIGFLKFSFKKYPQINEFMQIKFGYFYENLNLLLVDNLSILISLVFLLSVLSLTEKTNLKKKLTNLCGVLIYSPYLFLDEMYDAMIIGVGAHWSQYLLINYKVYFHNQKFNFYKKFTLLFIFSYSLVMSLVIYKFHMNLDVLRNIVLIPLTIHMFHFYIDAFIWRFSNTKIRETIGKRLFN